jgi:lysophospholipase L1-like esterase
MTHVVLLGDSIFDNGRYVPGEPDVAEQLRAALPSGWKVTLLAIDGDVIAGVAGQLARVPADATHLVISAGGNDALGASYLLGTRVEDVAEAVAVLGKAQQAFADDYRRMLGAVLARSLPTAVCTIYDTPTSSPDQPIIRSALAVFNDEISRAAFAHGLPLIDLRLICSDDADYANPIEPSAKGGAKIAGAIARLVTGGCTDNGSVVIA